MATFLLMERGNNFYTRSNAHISANQQTSGTVEKTLLANPGTISYDHLVFIVSLKNCIVTYVDMLAYFNVFWMKDKDAGFKDHPFAQRTEVGQLKCPGDVSIVLGGDMKIFPR